MMTINPLASAVAASRTTRLSALSSGTMQRYRPKMFEPDRAVRAVATLMFRFNGNGATRTNVSSRITSPGHRSLHGGDRRGTIVYDLAS